MKKIQVLFAAFIAILAMSFTLASHTQAFKSNHFSVSPGTYTTVSSGSINISAPANPVAPATKVAMVFTNVTFEGTAVNHSLGGCTAGQAFICAYLVANDTRIGHSGQERVIDAYFKQ